MTHGREPGDGEFAVEDQHPVLNERARLRGTKIHVRIQRGCLVVGRVQLPSADEYVTMNHSGYPQLLARIDGPGRRKPFAWYPVIRWQHDRCSEVGDPAV